MRQTLHGKQQHSMRTMPQTPTEKCPKSSTATNAYNARHATESCALFDDKGMMHRLANSQGIASSLHRGQAVWPIRCLAMRARLTKYYEAAERHVCNKSNPACGTPRTWRHQRVPSHAESLEPPPWFSKGISAARCQGCRPSLQSQCAGPGQTAPASCAACMRAQGCCSGGLTSVP